MKHDTLQGILAELFKPAIAAVAKLSKDQADPAIRPAGDPKFGDYQCNAALALARYLKVKPRDVAQRIKAAVDPGLSEIAEPLEIAGAGFLNIRLRSEFLAQYLGEVPRPTSDDHVGLQPVERPQRVVVEYSQPNIAKQMHVGHLRSTIIGDVFARVLEFEGHEVIRQNHVGDWGTSLGAVITGLWYLRARARRGEGLKDVQRRQAELSELRKDSVDVRLSALAPLRNEWEEDLQIEQLDQPAGRKPDIEELETAYLFVQTMVEAAKDTGLRVSYRRYGREHDDLLVDIPRKVTAMMQRRRDRENESEWKNWEQAWEVSVGYCQSVYDWLGVLLRREDIRGESFYEDRLPSLVCELRERFGENPCGVPPKSGDTTAPRAMVREDAGAVVVYLYDDHGEPRFKNPDGQILGMIIQKSDGAYLYATTDLAAIRFRLKELRFPSGVGAQRVIYVTDARQKLHFQMFFAAAHEFGWIAGDVQVEHVTFGSVLGPDRKPLKTREGGSVKLRELLDEAEKRAYALLESRDQGSEGSRDQGEEAPTLQFGEEEKRAIAQRVGIAAVKYADLCRDRNADYVFNWDTMLAMQGNTAPYMMYAYARIRSIYRKAAERFGSPDVYAPAVHVAITHPTERALALRLARLREAIDDVASNLTPHTLCTYLYELAAEFMRFYESCPVLAAKDEAARLSRMRLCDLTARTLKLGLGLLGIEVIERM